MRHPLEITPSQARAVVLRAQGLDRDAPHGEGREGVLGAIEHLGYVQIDTISVVERAHHHVIWSRVPDYAPEMLESLQEERLIFEYWSHAAAYLPMKDYRFSLPRMKSFRQKFHWSDDTPELRQAMRRVVARMRKDGALKARDFETKTPSPPGFWTFTKIEKRAMHELWMRGDIMISARHGFEKSYDLADRVLPAGVDRSVPTLAQTADHLIESTLRAQGIVREPELRYLRRGAIATEVRKRLALAVKKQRIVPIHVTGTDKPAYALAEMVASLPDAVPSDAARILSPFDNLVIQRERLKWIFGFDYQIECYVPEAKRKYGHFVLPVLWGDRFPARLEAKALRAQSKLVVKGIWFEPGMEKDRALRKALREELRRFAKFNKCSEVDDSLVVRRN